MGALEYIPPALGNTVWRVFAGDRTGTGDITTALASFLGAGGNCFIPEGDYLIAGTGADSGGVYFTLTKSLRVLCHPKARFFTDSLDNDFFHLSVPSDGSGLPTWGIDVEWHGGLIDQRNQKNSTSVPFNDPLGTPYYAPANPGSSATTTGLSINGDYAVSGTVYNGINLAWVKGLTIYSGSHWQVAGGDQGIFIGPGTNLGVVEECTFVGNRDVGIYGSNDATGAAGGRLVFQRNRYFNCMGGEAVKRSVHGFTFADSQFYNCILASYVSQLVGSGSAEGEIRNQRYEACTIHVRLDQAQNVSIVNCKGKSYGALLADGTSKATSYTPRAYWIRGSTYCAIKENKTIGVNSVWDADFPAHVYLESFNPGTGAVNCQYNDIADNVSDGFRTAGTEATGEADNNRFMGNYEISGAVKFIVPTGTNSSSLRYDYSIGRHINMTPVYWDDGSASAPMLARRGQTNTGFYFGTSKIGTAIAGTEHFYIDADGPHVGATKVGFLGAAPVVKQATFTQTYATTSTTVANPTATTLTDSSGGSPNTTIADAGASYDQTNQNNFRASIADAINKIIADVANVKQVQNALIDSQQAYGLNG